jgi:hypothetical protein
MKSVKSNVTPVKAVLAGLIFCFFALAALAQTVSPFEVPLYFEANKNQSEFLSRGSGYQFEISATGAQWALRQSAQTATIAQMRFVGANPRAVILGDGELPGKINYFTGSDSSQWQTGLPTFSRVQVSEIYPGINLVFHGNQRQLEYDFDLAPGANSDAIKIHFDGVDNISTTPDGQLVLKVGASEVRQPRPEIYQTVAGARNVVPGGYKILDARTVAFEMGTYDHSLALVIDPVLNFSAFFGGLTSSTGWAIALNTNSFADSSNGYVYIAGETLSKHFFTKGAFQTNYGGGEFNGDAFVAKFTNPATNLLYLTYLGGTNDDAAFSLAVDAAGNAFVAGFTDSSNFPTFNALQPHIASKFDPAFGFNPGSGFVAELDPTGSQLIFSTYLGGSYENGVEGIALDSADNVYAVGYTSSTNFPVTANALQKTLLCTNDEFLNFNGFVTEIASNDANLVYSTYLGGTNYDDVTSVAVDPNNYVYVAGYTASYNFPVINAPTNNTFTNFPALDRLNGSTNKTSDDHFDAFVAKFPPLATQPSSTNNLVYSTFLGGTNTDEAYGIAADSSGNAYVTGWTTSHNFPVVFQGPNTNNPAGLYSFLSTNTSASTLVFMTNVFLTKIAPQGSNILGSLVFGGNGADIGYKVAVDPAGNAFVIGAETSTNFPTTNTFYVLAATNTGSHDVFVASFNPDWSAMNYSVCLGGKHSDFGYGIALDASDNAFITGYTTSTNFPAQSAGRFAFTITNIVFTTNVIDVTNVVEGTNVITTTNMITTSTNVDPANTFINGTNFINGAKLTGTNDAFLAEIQFTPPAPSNIVVTPFGETNGVGADMTFSVTGNGQGTPVLFQWQRFGFTNLITLFTNSSGVVTNRTTNSIPAYTNLLNKANFSGVNSENLSITNIQTNDAGNYQVVIFYGGPPIDISNILLDVETPPVIVTPPTDQTNVIDTTATFTVSALGQSPLHYQWQFNGTNLINGTHVSGVTTNTLTLSDITTNEAGTYDVIVTNAFGSTNVSATLTVLAAPTILIPLTNEVVGLGATVPFALTVVGATPMHFNWTMNGNKLTNGIFVRGTTTNIISGATNATLTLTGATTNDDGTYAVTVTNAFGSTNSSAMLTVLTTPMFTTMSLINGSNLAGGLTINGVGATNDGFYYVFATSNLLLSPIQSTWSNLFKGQIPSPGSFTATILPSGPGGISELTNWQQAYFILIQSNSSFSTNN